MLGATFSIKLVEAAQCPAIVVPKAWKPGRGPVVVGIKGDTQDEAPFQFAVHEARCFIVRFGSFTRGTCR